MPENKAELGKIIAKAWRDPAFKAALMANPAAALQAEGIDVPDGMAVTVVENTDNHVHLVVPPKPAMALSDEDLEAIRRDRVPGSGVGGRRLDNGGHRDELR